MVLIFSLHCEAFSRLMVFIDFPPPRSRQHPGHRVLDAGGDLSSGSSESHTDVARRNELRYAPGLVNSSGCLHAGSRGQVLAYREVEAVLIYDRRIGTPTPGTTSFWPVGRRGEKPGRRWRKRFCTC